MNTTSLRQAFGSFVTGVTVITTINAERWPCGMTANSFTSVSMEPPLVLVCIGQSTGSYKKFCVASSFAINILSAEQQQISELFASKSPHKFEHTAWRQEYSGAPVIEGALAWIDCAVHEKSIAGDHMILIGRVLDFGRERGLPLGFFGGSYVTFNLDWDVESLTRNHAMIGGVIEVDGSILLCRDTANGGWTIPVERHLGAELKGREALIKKCLALGFSVDPTFVYSIFTDSGTLVILYRCVVSSRVNVRTTSTTRLFDIDQLPWQEIYAAPVRAVLRRYIRERASNRFGIYVESDNGGQVGMLDGEPVAFQNYRSAAKVL